MEYAENKMKYKITIIPYRSPPLNFDILRFQMESSLQLKRKLRFSNHFRKTWITLLSLVMAIMHTIIEFLLFIWNSTSSISWNVYNINFRATKVCKMCVILLPKYQFYTSANSLHELVQRKSPPQAPLKMSRISERGV